MSYNEKIASMFDEDEQEIAAEVANGGRGGWSIDGKTYDESIYDNAAVTTIKELRYHTSQLQDTMYMLTAAADSIQAILDLLPQLDDLITERDFLKAGYKGYAERYRALVQELGEAIKYSSNITKKIDA